ncbi:MAG: hypothetical protein ACRC8S_11270 [Fimbriiglobus sp.]
MENFSRHQQGIIKRYYENIDGIQLQKLADLVGELYLAEGKKKEKVWKSIVGLMTKMEIPQTRIDHIVNSGKPEMVAQLVKELSAT